jgi:predicted transcriptional regulator
MARTTNDPKTVFVATKISPELNARLDRYAAARDWTKAQTIRNCVADVVMKDAKLERVDA